MANSMDPDQIWVHAVCFYTNTRQILTQLFAAGDQQTTFSDAFFLGALRIKSVISKHTRFGTYRKLANTQMPLINAHTDVSRKTGGLMFGLGLQLHPYFVNVSSKGSGVGVCAYALTHLSRHCLLMPR